MGGGGRDRRWVGRREGCGGREGEVGCVRGCGWASGMWWERGVWVGGRERYVMGEWDVGR